MKNRLTFKFSKIQYRDYLLTNECLDDNMLSSDNTFRDKYFNLDKDINLGSLSNICGVGLFIITSDNKVIVSHTSKNVTVNSGVCSYSSGGTMDWNTTPHPFNDVKRECKEELEHIIDINCTFLFSFGIDKTKGYYQFNFVEYSYKDSDTIIRNSKMAKDYSAEFAKLEAIDLNYKEIIKHINKYAWADVAAAALITLCTKAFGKNEVENFVSHKEIYEDYKKRMKFVWQHRANREGVSAVLSSRFPTNEIDNISENYINRIVNFIGDSVCDKNILEIGSGIGLVTREIVSKSNSVTCVDISKEMLNKHRINLSNYQNKIDYHEMFFQDFNAKTRVDIIICSLVLVHNSRNDKLLSRFIENMKFYANTIFLFEPIDTGIQASSDSKSFSIDDYKGFFKDYAVVKEEQYLLHVDNILLLKLERIPNHNNGS